jgi:hypothetical protein
MPTTLREFVLETLTSPFVNRLNFQFDTMLVYPNGYCNDIAACIRGGSIRLTSNAAAISTTPEMIVASGTFVVDTEPGQVHPFFISPRLTTQGASELLLRDDVAGNERARLRGTIIHEATHALQDYQRQQLDPLTAEAAAYLAGAITMRQWGFRTFGPIVNPHAGIHAYSLTVADRFLAEPNAGRRYVIPPADVTALRGHAAASTGTAHRYVFNGI